MFKSLKELRKPKDVSVHESETEKLLPLLLKKATCTITKSGADQFSVDCLILSSINGENDKSLAYLCPHRHSPLEGF